MTSRERLRALIAGQPADRCGFWMGNPHHDTWPGYLAHFGCADAEALRLKLRDDFRWHGIQWGERAYRHPGGYAPFQDLRPEGEREGPILGACEKPSEIDGKLHWPDAGHYHFGQNLQNLRDAGPFYRAGGMWCCFYHDLMGLFGMDKYMMDMIQNPGLVHAVTDRVCQWYYDVNERYFAEAAEWLDGFFLGNDFGTQLDLICGPAQFDEFIMPWFRRFTEQGHRFGLQVILHSCGAIHKVIGRFIDAGVDCLHPIQALARGMDAETLARDFGGRITFMGGVDTQQLLVHGDPGQIRAEVRRLKALLGPRFIVSPSHECLLPNVPAANVAAMAEEAVLP